MNGTTIKLMYFVFDLILPLSLGYVLSLRLKDLKKLFDTILDVNILVLSPVLAILSFWIIRLDAQLIWLPIFGVVMQFVPGTVGYIISRKRYKDPLDQGSYILSTMLSNRGNVGMLTCFILYGELGYALNQLVMLFSNMVQFMFCFPMAQYFYELSANSGQKARLSVKSILFNKRQIAVLGLFVGFLLNMRGIPRPKVFDDFFQYSIHVNAWTSIVPIGYFVNLSEVRKYIGHIWDVVAVKFLLTPLVVYLLAVLIIKDPTALRVVLILSISPTAINAVVTSKLYKLNIHVSMSAFLLTTGIYIFLVFPILILLVRI